MATKYISETYLKAFKKYYLEAETVGVNKHVKIYVLSLFLFILLNTVTFKGEYWFQYPAAAWAIGLGIHYFTVRELHEELDKVLEKAHKTATELNSKHHASPSSKGAKKTVKKGPKK